MLNRLKQRNKVEKSFDWQKIRGTGTQLLWFCRSPTTIDHRVAAIELGRKEPVRQTLLLSLPLSFFLSISLFFLNLLPLNHEIYGLKNSRTGESFALSVMYWSCLCRGKRPLLATPWTMPGPTIWIRDPLLPLPSRFRCTGVSHPAPLMIYIDEKDGTRKIERIEGRVEGRWCRNEKSTVTFKTRRATRTTVLIRVYESRNPVGGTGPTAGLREN